MRLVASCVIVFKSRNNRNTNQTVDAFDETYYLANYVSLTRSVNLVLQAFIHRHTRFRMRIVLSMHFISFANIGETF